MDGRGLRQDGVRTATWTTRAARSATAAARTSSREGKDGRDHLSIARLLGLPAGRCVRRLSSPGSGLRCWRCARRFPGRLLPGRRTLTPGRGRASPHSTAERVSRARGWARAEVSCLHTRQQWVQAKRRTRTTSCVGLHPTGTWARRRVNVPRDTPWAPQALQNGSSNPICMRHSTTACLTARCWPTAVSPRASRPRKVIRSGSVKVVSGTSKSLVTGCVAAPIIGGPRPLPTATTHPPHL